VDFTYLAALFIAIFCGVIVALVSLVATRMKARTVLFAAFASALAVNLVGLIDWDRVDPNELGFLALDLLFFTVFGLVGCSLGAGLVFGIRRIYRLHLAN